ncbi:MAG: hypothetical protein ACTSUE_19735 [Promethearchaeota archaeon]
MKILLINNGLTISFLKEGAFNLGRNRGHQSQSSPETKHDFGRINKEKVTNYKNNGIK